MAISKHSNSKKGSRHLINDFFFIKAEGLLKKVNVEDVLYVENVDNQCFIKTKTNKFIVNLSLIQLMERLSLFNFERCHQSYLVQLNSIDVLDSGKDEIEIYNHILPIGKPYKKQLISRLELF